MKRNVTLFFSLLFALASFAQTNPAITSWLRNTTGTKGRHYVKGNSTPINDADSANVQTVYYSNNYVYIRTKGIPTYVTGPYFDGNPSNATTQNATFKFTLNPTKKTGTSTNTTGGNIGVFINGVALFDYRDGVSWKNSTGALAGGPSGGVGDGVWNRDAIVGELLGFDCSKGHPAMGNYHHHQNPSAFKLDLNVKSTVCNLYNSDALYTLDSTKHAPLLGFAYDGFPIYGAFAYKNVDGTGGITRIKSSYALRNITTRTTYSTGATVTAGPVVSTTYPLGYFREDYQYNTTSSATPDYLDEHNGRFCITPEYPNGIYCYFATVDANWNSAYPYVIGPTFYGVYARASVTSITETVTQYNGSTLPLNVTAFSGVFSNKSNNLKWKLGSVAETKFFDIEKSKAGTEFSKIGSMNASNKLSYSFIDNAPFAGNNYYRLKIWDATNQFSYSNIVLVNMKENDFSVRVFPNPANDYVIVQANDLIKNDIQVNLINMKGQIVLRKVLPQGSTLCYLETSTLYAGEYVVSLYDDKGTKQSFKININK